VPGRGRSTPDLGRGSKPVSVDELVHKPPHHSPPSTESIGLVSRPDSRRHTQPMDHRLGALAPTAALQQGAFSRLQAQRAGISDDVIAANLAANRWQRLHPGVFLVFTGPVPYSTRLWAGLLWAGEGAALCDATALGEHGLTGHEDADLVHVTVDHERKVVDPPGLKVYRRRRLEAFVHPVRVPRLVRLEDAALHRASRLDSLSAGLGLLADVCQQRLTTPNRLRDALAELPKLKSRKALWAVLDDIAVGAQSFLEITYLRRVERRHGLPAPCRQARSSTLGPRVWRDGQYDDWGVILELDGRLGHDGSHEQAKDRRRDLVVASQGRITLRHGYVEVVDQACETAALVARVLQTRGWTGEPVACGPHCGLPQTLQASPARDAGALPRSSRLAG
jgi:hypothetical protein